MPTAGNGWVRKTPREDMQMPHEEPRKRPGRPRAIPEAVIPRVLEFHRRGLGYRAIARELAREGLSPDWSTVRRVIKREAG